MAKARVKRKRLFGTYRVRCDCGRWKIMHGSRLLHGDKSCGCNRNGRSSPINTRRSVIIEQQGDLRLVRIVSDSSETDYEVWRMQDGKPPADEQWGTHGFTYGDLDSARKKFQELLA